ncbi:FAD-dependent monooxygenase [Streptomyces sp. I05A-00742]|uniref:FAD-dependent monooxygenase n=1 Tax=Streptomyces sp. I05A-00742 TaxID=2732853 RepID=UPI0020182392|nr:FAD-dependent monooxygenase [Streptomyces sp. I05A-00742]
MSVMPSSGSALEAGVLVVGAGPTGLVLACDLARQGVPFRLVDAAPQGFAGSRGKGLQPRTLEILEDLGVAGRALASGAPLPLMSSWRDGEMTAEWDMITRTGPTPDAPYGEPLMLPQWRTQEILRERLRELGGRVEFGTRLTAVTQDADGVTARLETADGPAAEVRAAWLVASDGGRSTVRSLLGTPFTGHTVDPDPMLVADVRLEGLPRTHWHTWRDHPSGMLALCPLSATDAFQLIAGFAAGEPDPSPDAVRALIAERTGLTAGAVDWSSVFRARAAMAERFREGRVFLAGDAAHVHSPAGAQGLNTGVQDAYNLGWKLGHVLRHGAPDALLDSYQAERLPVAAEVLGFSTRIHRGTGQAGSKLMGHRGREAHQLDLHYRTGPLSRETRTGLPEGALRAGDRAPDAPCATDGGQPVRLFDLFRGTHFTLLATGSAADALEDAAETAGPPVRAPRVTDTEGHVERAYGDGLFVVRPDGYVGLATEDVAEVREYVAGFGKG